MAMTDDEFKSLRAWVGKRVEWDTARTDLQRWFGGTVARGVVVDVTTLGLLLVRPDGYENALPPAWVHLDVRKLREPAPMTGCCPRCGYAP